MKRGLWMGGMAVLVILGLAVLALALDWPPNSGKTNCLDCHLVHHALGGKLVKATTINNLCLSCHAAGPGRVAATHRGLSCTTCHEPHTKQGQNLLHIRTTVLTTIQGPATVTFVNNRTPPTDFARGAPTYDGICEVCHSTTAYHRYRGGGLPHNNGAVCTDCHKHSKGFAPTGDCTLCHDRERGSGTFAAGTRRRIIVGSSGDFDGGQLGGHMIGQSPTAFECVVCHKEGSVDTNGEVTIDSSFHRNGSQPHPIDLRNVDDASGSLAVYTNPSGPVGQRWGAASASRLTEFCLRCHDGDGALQHFTRRAGAGGSPTAPFGDKASAPLDVVNQFLVGNFSSHAINSSRGGLGRKYAADYPADPQAIKSGAFVPPWSSASTTGCADCHLGQENAGTPRYYHNAHGGRNLKWLMKDRNGKDAAFQNPSRGPGQGGKRPETASSTITCFACHDPQVYVGKSSLSRFPKHEKGDHRNANGNVFYIGCMNCHGGDEAGGIHGTNLNTDIDDDGHGPYKRVRFTNGASLDFRSNTTNSKGEYTCSSHKTIKWNNLWCRKHSEEKYRPNY